MGQVLTMPLFFASNAIYPIALMPTWLEIISHINPLTYEVDALRALMLAHGTSLRVARDANLDSAQAQALRVKMSSLARIGLSES